MKKDNLFIYALATLLVARAFLFGDSSYILTKTDRVLNDDEYDMFILGRSFFKIPWVEAPSATTARDGLGPLFNANTCHTCHPRNGRGAARDELGQLDKSVIVKLSRKPQNELERKLVKTQGLLGDKVYGSQLQTRGIYGVPYEVKYHINTENFTIFYPDGKSVTLQKPVLELEDLKYGKFGKDSSFTIRTAQSLHGVGYIDLIDEKDILSNEDEFDKNGDGISGRANWVYSRDLNKFTLGRFNWKASTPSVKEQTALAFHDDMGISNPLYPSLPCTKYQKECLNAPKPRDDIDLPYLRLDAVSFFVSNLKLPKQNITQKEGEKLFEKVGCTSCHRPSYVLKNGKVISPYSDFLLHDMGKNLSDGVGNFKAKGSEWRTQPLWGLSLAKTILKKKPGYLHDGRAKTLEEAILWHGGEALRVKLNFMNLHAEQREELIKFLKEL